MKKLLFGLAVLVGIGLAAAIFHLVNSPPDDVSAAAAEPVDGSMTIPPEADPVCSSFISQMQELKDCHARQVLFETNLNTCTDKIVETEGGTSDDAAYLGRYRGYVVRLATCHLKDKQPEAARKILETSLTWTEWEDGTENVGGCGGQLTAKSLLSILDLPKKNVCQNVAALKALAGQNLTWEQLEAWSQYVGDQKALSAGLIDSDQFCDSPVDEAFRTIRNSWAQKPEIVVARVSAPSAQVEWLDVELADSANGLTRAKLNFEGTKGCYHLTGILVDGTGPAKTPGDESGEQGP